MKKLICTALGASLLFASQPASATFSGSNGSVTPNSMTITFTSLKLFRTDGSELVLLTGNYPTTFTRAGSNLAAVKLDNITAPAGRYIGVSLGMLFSYKVKLDGDKYHGVTGGGFTDNVTPVYSIGTDATANNSVTATVSTAVTASNLTSPGVGQAEGDTRSYFANTVCIAKNAKNCKAGDTIVGAPGTPLPDLNIMLDLYNAVQIDTTNKSMGVNNSYPVPMLGQPGAAIHLQESTTGAEWMMIFAGDKSLLSTRGFVSKSIPAPTQPPSGGGFVNPTAGPGLINAYGPTALMVFTESTGTVQTPAGNTGANGGLLTFPAVTKTAIGSTVAQTCTADTTGSLGYTYTGGTCAGIANATYTVVRIIDPGNIFGKCATTDPGYIANSGGTCVISTAVAQPGGYL